MRYIFTVLFLFNSYLIFSQDHNVNFSVGSYYEQADFWDSENLDRVKYYGGVISARHSLKGIDYVGTDFELCYDNENELVINFGVTLRKRWYQDFIETDILLPRLNWPVGAKGYNSPFGFSARMFRGNCKIKYTAMFYMNGVVSRVGVNYWIN